MSWNWVKFENWVFGIVFVLVALGIINWVLFDVFQIVSRL